MIFRSLLEAKADGARPPCKGCRAMLPCQECSGLDFRECNDCKVMSAPWRECAADDCTFAVCDECAEIVCDRCDGTPCSDHLDMIDYMHCDECEKVTCDDCMHDHFHLTCGRQDCNTTNCLDCAFKGEPFMCCTHCSDSSCWGCAFKADPYLICSTCCDASCWDCAFKEGRFHMFCNSCGTNDCSSCAFSDGKYYDCCGTCGGSWCSECLRDCDCPCDY